MSSIPHIRSLRDVRGAGQSRLTSIPKQQRSVHLDLYVMAREKDRLEKELSQVRTKSGLLEKRLAQSHKRMNELLGEVGGRRQGDQNAKHGKRPAAAVKKMRIEY